MKARNYITKETDSRSYTSGYEIFLSRTNFREKILACFKEASLHYVGKNKDLKILDIGCGNGLMTKRYLSALPETNLRVSLLEPGREALLVAEAELASISDHVTTINQSAEEYFSHQLEKEKFDLLIASYVFYHLSSKLIPNILDSITPGGHLVVMMGAKEHPLRNHPTLRALSKHGDSSELKEALEELRRLKKILFHVESTITDLDLNGLWKKGELTSDGEKFFSFTYNQDLSNFSEEHHLALRETLGDIFKNSSGIAHPTHELIWVTKL